MLAFKYLRVNTSAKLTLPFTYITQCFRLSFPSLLPAVHSPLLPLSIPSKGRLARAELPVDIRNSVFQKSNSLSLCITHLLLLHSLKRAITHHFNKPPSLGKLPTLNWSFSSICHFQLVTKFYGFKH